MTNNIMSQLSRPVKDVEGLNVNVKEDGDTIKAYRDTNGIRAFYNMCHQKKMLVDNKRNQFSS